MPRLVMTPAIVARADALAKTHTRHEVATAIGVDYRTLGAWAKRNNRTFKPDRCGRPPGPARLPREIRHGKPGAKPTVMTAERALAALDLARRNYSLTASADLLGVGLITLRNWAVSRRVEFADGRRQPLPDGRNFRDSETFKEAARRNQAKATAAAAAKRRLPLDKKERGRYDAWRQTANAAGISYTRDDAFRAIGRDDLVGWGR